MNHPLLFLDVDGVLNTRMGSLNPDKLDLLQGIIAHTQARIILSSSWRRVSHQLARLTQALADLGLTIHDHTPHLEKEEGILWTALGREAEITAYLQAHYTTRFVILDDIPMQALRPWQILCDLRTGLTLQQAEEAITLLKIPPVNLPPFNPATPTDEMLEFERAMKSSRFGFRRSDEPGQTYFFIETEECWRAWKLAKGLA